MKSPSTSTSPDGFSLIEIMIAMGLIAAAAGLGLGADMRAFRGLRSEERTLVSALREARSQAMRNLERADHGVHYDPGARCRSYARCYVVFAGIHFDPSAVGNVEFESDSSALVSWPDHDPVFRRLDGVAEPAEIRLSRGRRSTSVTIGYEGRIDAR